MARTKKINAEKVEEVKIGETTVLVWRATRPLSEAEHEQLSEKLRYESEQSGARIVLVPFSVEWGVDAKQTAQDDPEGGEKATEPVSESPDGNPPEDGSETGDSPKQDDDPEDEK